mgnify:CR=1 FL=1
MTWGAPQHAYGMLGLMPPDATLAYGQGSGPKGSTSLGIRYGGRGHWPGSGRDTEIPVESLYGGPSRPLADGRQSHPPPLPLGEIRAVGLAGFSWAPLYTVGKASQSWPPLKKSKRVLD